jgi:hypothetical protein
MDELLARADPPDPAKLLEAAGWECSEVTVQELCRTYGRSLSLTDPVGPGPVQAASAGADPTKGSSASRGGFVTAWKP